MPKSGDHISLRNDIDPGRRTHGRNRVSDPKGGQTAISDYTGKNIGGFKVAGYTNYKHLRTTRIQFGEHFDTEIIVRSMGRHQAQIFNNPKNWDWQAYDPYSGKVLNNYPICLWANYGTRARWICTHNEPGWGKWMSVRARFKDPGGINNHIPGITNWHESQVFRYCGAVIPKVDRFTKGEDSNYGGPYTGYGLNNGYARFRVHLPTGEGAGPIYRHGKTIGPGMPGPSRWESLSYYTIDIYNPSNGLHLGSVTVKPGQYGYIHNLNSGGSTWRDSPHQSTMTTSLRWIIRGYDKKGQNIIPAFGSGAHRPSYRPGNMPLYYSGTNWTGNLGQTRIPNI